MAAPRGTTLPLVLAPSAAAAAAVASGSGRDRDARQAPRGATLLRYEFMPAGVDAAAAGALSVDERTGEYSLTRPGVAGRPPTRFGGHAGPRRPGSGSLDSGSATASCDDGDVECVAVLTDGVWTLHAVDAAVTLRVRGTGEVGVGGGGGRRGGEGAAAARPPPAAAAVDGDDDATSADDDDDDDELGAELEAALEEGEGEGDRPRHGVTDLEREFWGG